MWTYENQGGQWHADRLAGGASGEWADSSAIPTVDFFGNISYPDGTVVDAAGTVYNSDGSVQSTPAGEAASAAGETIYSAASGIASNVEALVGNVLTAGKWIIIGVVALAVLEISSRVSKGK